MSTKLQTLLEMKKLINREIIAESRKSKRPARMVESTQKIKYEVIRSSRDEDRLDKGKNIITQFYADNDVEALLKVIKNIDPYDTNNKGYTDKNGKSMENPDFIEPTLSELIGVIEDLSSEEVYDFVFRVTNKSTGDIIYDSGLSDDYIYNDPDYVTVKEIKNW